MPLSACGFFPCEFCWSIWEVILLTIFILIACYFRSQDGWVWYRRVKPIPIGLMLLFMILGFAGVGWEDPSFHDPAFFVLSWLGLLFGGIGDILLTNRTYIIAGIISFGVGHLFYFAAFVRYPFVLPLWLTLFFSLPCVVFLGGLVVKGPKNSRLEAMGEKEKYGLLALVGGYGVVLVMTVMFAMNLGEWAWREGGISTGIGLGAVLFCLSDILLIVFGVGGVGRGSVVLSQLPLFIYYVSQGLLAHGTVCFCFSLALGTE